MAALPLAERATLFDSHVVKSKLQQNVIKTLAAYRSWYKTDVYLDARGQVDESSAATSYKNWWKKN